MRVCVQDGGETGDRWRQGDNGWRVDGQANADRETRQTTDCQTEVGTGRQVDGWRVGETDRCIRLDSL